MDVNEKGIEVVWWFCENAIKYSDSPGFSYGLLLSIAKNQPDEEPEKATVERHVHFEDIFFKLI